jgi:uncharacterized protein YjbI with pentapeptide repeats
MSEPSMMISVSVDTLREHTSAGGANLREANLRGANLRGANLRGADLRRGGVVA